MVAALVYVYPEHLGELGCGNDYGGGIGKTVDYGMREQVDNQTESQDTQ